MSVLSQDKPPVCASFLGPGKMNCNSMKYLFYSIIVTILLSVSGCVIVPHHDEDGDHGGHWEHHDDHGGWHGEDRDDDHGDHD